MYNETLLFFIFFFFFVIFALRSLWFALKAFKGSDSKKINKCKAFLHLFLCILFSFATFISLYLMYNVRIEEINKPQLDSLESDIIVLLETKYPEYHIIAIYKSTYTPTDKIYPPMDSCDSKEIIFLDNESQEVDFQQAKYAICK